jgi:hypothetical protein
VAFGLSRRLIGERGEWYCRSDRYDVREVVDPVLLGHGVLQAGRHGAWSVIAQAILGTSRLPDPG